MLLLNKMVNVHQIAKHHPHAVLARDILEYYGYEMPQEIAYGLSMGIGFEYINHVDTRLTSDYKLDNLYIGGFFSLDRRKIANNLRIWLDIYRFGDDSKEKGFQYIYNYLKMGRPIIVEVDIILYRDYVSSYDFGSTFLFGFDVENNILLHGYNITVIGYDEEKNECICLDPYIDELIHIPRSTFDEMCYSQKENIHIEGERSLIVVPRHKNVINLEIAIIASIRNSIYEFNNPYIMGDNYFLGKQGLIHFIEEFSTWKQRCSILQLKKSIQMIYFNSEVIAGHTGLYRIKYSEFLVTSSKITGNDTLLKAAKCYKELGEMWSEILEIMYQESLEVTFEFEKISKVVAEKLKVIKENEFEAIKILSEAICEPCDEREDIV